MSSKFQFQLRVYHTNQDGDVHLWISDHKTRALAEKRYRRLLAMRTRTISEATWIARHPYEIVECVNGRFT